MSLALLFHYLLLNMFRMLIHPSSGACDLLMSYFMGLLFWFDVRWCYVVVCLGWCGVVWCGVVSGCRLKHYFSLLHGCHPNLATLKLQHTSKQEHTTNVVIH